MTSSLLQTGTRKTGKTVKQIMNVICQIIAHFLILGIFGQQGMDYQDWLDCTIKHPLAMN